MFRPTNLPTAQTFKEALIYLEGEMTTSQKEVLRHLYQASDRTMTATEIAHALGYIHFASVNIQFGKLGHLLADEMNYLPKKRSNGSYRWWNVLALGQVDPSGFSWTMHPELAEALTQLGWFAQGG